MDNDNNVDYNKALKIALSISGNKFGNFNFNNTWELTNKEYNNIVDLAEYVIDDLMKDKDDTVEKANKPCTKPNITSDTLNVITRHRWNYDGKPANISVENEQTVIRDSHNKIVWFCDLDTVGFTYVAGDYNKIIFCDENNIDFELTDEE